ncbi:unnamed protein product, partial [marine sediment metagenome]
ELQNELSHYPHTSYLPHLSLSLHHHFSALILYFLMRRADGGLPPTELKFSVLTVSPEPMALFYRLRDVATHQRVINKLRNSLFSRVFRFDKAALTEQLAPACNPFEFFDGGSGLVLVYDQPDKITHALQEILDDETSLRSLLVEQTDFRLTGKWMQEEAGEQSYFKPTNVETHSRTWSLLSATVMNYPTLS